MLPGKAVEGSQVGGTSRVLVQALRRCSVTLKETPCLSFPLCKVGATLGQPQCLDWVEYLVSAAILLLTSNKPGTKG